jgi:hypothetical protein
MNQQSNENPSTIDTLDEASAALNPTGSGAAQQSFRVVRDSDPAPEDPGATIRDRDTVTATVVSRIDDGRIVAIFPHDEIGKPKIILYDSSGQMADIVDAELVARWQEPVSEQDQAHLSEQFGLNSAQLQALVSDLLDKSEDQLIQLDFNDEEVGGVHYRYENGRVEYVEWGTAENLQTEIEAAFEETTSARRGDIAARQEEFAAAEQTAGSVSGKAVIAFDNEVRALDVKDVASHIPSDFSYCVIKNVPVRIDVQDITKITAESGGSLGLEQDADGEVIIAHMESLKDGAKVPINDHHRNLLDAFFLKLLLQGSTEMQFHVK